MPQQANREIAAMGDFPVLACVYLHMPSLRKLSRLRDNTSYREFLITLFIPKAALSGKMPRKRVFTELSGFAF